MLKTTKNKLAFTMAEVLITLGIVGVIAAMTLPAIMQKNTNKVVEARLAKFYTSINQALLRAEEIHGDRKYWYQDKNTVIKDEDGKVVRGASDVEKWWDFYIAPHMNTIKISYDEDDLPQFHFEDGSVLVARHPDGMRDWLFYVGDPERCKRRYQGTSGYGKCAFLFVYMPGIEGNDLYNSPMWEHHLNKGFEPYKYGWDGSLEGLKKNKFGGCNADKYETRGVSQLYCSALIQYYGWTIPKDYPFTVSY